MRRLLFSLFLFFLILPIVFADIQEDYYQSGQGTFSSQITTIDFTASVDTLEDDGAIIPPVYYDLDSDGVKEMIVTDNTQIRLYHVNISDSRFSIVDSYNNAERLLTKFQVLNISGTPTIYYVTNDNWHTLQYNGTGFVHNTTVQNFPNGDGGFGCGENIEAADNHYCIYYTDNDQTGVNADMDIYYVNVTDPNNMVGMGTLEVNTNACVAGEEFHTNTRPELRGVTIDDTDNDGFSEIYFIWGAPCGGATYNNRVIITEVESDLSTVTERIIGHTGITCYAEDAAADLPFTMPLVRDVDQSPGNGKEISVGCIVDSTNGDDYKVGVWQNDLNIFDDYPEIGNVEGTILSNLFLLDCFSDTGVEDIGILGYDQDEDEVDLLCINPNSGISDTTREFDPLNVTNASVNSTLVYTAGMGSPQSHLLTPYGSLQVNPTTALITSEGSLSLGFSHPYGGVTIPMQIGEDPLDLLVATRTNIWWLDDGFSNTNPHINVEFNPCNPVLLDEPVRASVTLLDNDGDTVNFTLVAYAGETNQQIVSSANFASGGTYEVEFQANESTTGTLIIIYAEDNSPESAGNRSLTYNMIVTSNNNTGRTFGECEGSASSIPVVAVNETSTDVQANNSAQQLMNTLNQTTGLGSTVLWFMIMGGVALFIVTEKNTGLSMGATLAVLTFIEVILLIIGVYVGFVGVGVIIILVILGLLLSIPFLRRLFAGG